MHERFYTALILAAMLTAFSGCGNKSAEEPPPPLVRTITVGDVSSTETGYSGTVRGRYETRLAFQVGGQILSRNVDAGAHVRAGDVLMVIDARDVQQQANAAGAGVAAARSRYELARTELARYEELYAAQAISAAMLDQYRTNERAAEAAYRQAHRIRRAATRSATQTSSQARTASSRTLRQRRDRSSPQGSPF